MGKLVLKSHHVSRPVAYSFRFESYGWAIFTLNDQTGELSLHSDWGTYGHRWHIDALGSVRAADGSERPRTLHEFLTGCDGDYVVRKFQLDTKSKELEDVVDDEKTKAGVRERIIEERRARSIDRETARELWKQTDEWADYKNFDLHSIDSELSSFLGEFWEYVCTRPSARFVFLREELWPFFRDWLRVSVVEPARAAAVVGCWHCGSPLK